MTLAFFFFSPQHCFLNQKEHVVKCLWHRHWPILLVEKGAAVLQWPGGWAWFPAGGCVLMASPSKTQDLQSRVHWLCSPFVCSPTWSWGFLLFPAFLSPSFSPLSFPHNQRLCTKFTWDFPLQSESTVVLYFYSVNIMEMSQVFIFKLTDF